MSNLDKKVIVLSLLFIMIFSVFCPLFSYGATDKDGNQIVEFSNWELEQLLVNSEYNTNNDNSISVNELKAIDYLYLNLSNSYLTNIDEMFKYTSNVTAISLTSESLESIDLTSLSKLESFYIECNNNIDSINIKTNLFLYKTANRISANEITNAIHGIKLPNEINLIVGEKYYLCDTIEDPKTIFGNSRIANISKKYDYTYQRYTLNIKGVSVGSTTCKITNSLNTKDITVNVKENTIVSNPELIKDSNITSRFVGTFTDYRNVLMSNGDLYEISNEKNPKAAKIDTNVLNFVSNYVYRNEDAEDTIYFMLTLNSKGILDIKTREANSTNRLENTQFENIKAIGNTVYERSSLNNNKILGYYLTNDGDYYAINANKENLKVRATLLDTDVDYLCGDYYVKGNGTYYPDGTKISDFAIDSVNRVGSYVAAKNKLYEIKYEYSNSFPITFKEVATDFDRFYGLEKNNLYVSNGFSIDFHGTYVNTDGNICNENFEEERYYNTLESDMNFYYQDLLKLTNVTMYMETPFEGMPYFLIRKDGSVWYDDISESFTNNITLLITPEQKEGPTYKVVFKDYDGTILKTEIVDAGKNATPPTLKDRKGYKFTGWDKAFISVSSDLTVTANYQEYVSPFKDVKDTAFYSSALEYLYKNGYVTGTSKTTFSPNDKLSRAMLVTILWNMEGRPKASGTNKFSDVKNGAWYTDAIVWASTNGVVNGNKDGTFAPNANITRQEVAVMLANYSRFKKQYKAPAADLNSFKDNNKVASWAKDSVRWAVENKVIGGAEGGTKINPLNNATRGEAITMVKNYIDNIK